MSALSVFIIIFLFFEHISRLLRFLFVYRDSFIIRSLLTSISSFPIFFKEIDIHRFDQSFLEGK